MPPCCDLQQVKKRKKCHFPPTPQQLRGKIMDWGSAVGEGKIITKGRLNRHLITATFMPLKPHQCDKNSLKWHPPALLTTTQIIYETMLADAQSCFSTMLLLDRSFMQHFSLLSPSLSISKCWIYLPLAAIAMTPPIDLLAWKLVAGKVVVRD